MWRRVALAALVLAALGAAAVYLATSYLGPLRFHLGPISVTSSQLFRPAVVLLACYGGFLALRAPIPARSSVGVLLICLAAYSIGPFGAASGDVVPSEYVALSIARGLGTSLDAYPELYEEGVPYFVTDTPSGLRSTFPIGPALVAWPLYLLAPISGLERPELVDRLGRLASILVALCSVWLAIRIATRLDPPVGAHALALVYGLGTSHWSVSSAQLWQHGVGELWLLGALDRLLDGDTPPRRRFLALGACLGLAVFTRPVLALPAALVGGYAAWRHVREARHLLTGAAAIVVPVALENVAIYGSPVGGYASHLQNMVAAPLGGGVERAFWLVFSPSRGVAWFEPVVALSLVLAGAGIGRSRTRPLLLLGLTGCAAIWVTYSRWEVWWGGHCFGPRFMTDALPMWFVAVASLGPLHPRARGAVLLLAAAGGLVTAASRLGTDPHWNDRPSIDWFPERAQTLLDSQLAASFLTMLPGSRLATAQEAMMRGDAEASLRHLGAELREHPWNRFAAIRLADTLVRVGRIAEARERASELRSRWREDAYLRHLDARLPAIARFLAGEPWERPLEVAVSRNESRAENVLDGTIATAWTTGTPQRATDWIALRLDPARPVRGIVLICAPDFGHGPSGLEIWGETDAGRLVLLSSHRRMTAPLKGWVALRFPPRRLRRITAAVPRFRSAPWTVSEARVLVEQVRN